MKRKAVYFLIPVCVLAVLTGYYAGAGTLSSEQVQEERPAAEERYAESSDMKAPSANPEETEGSYKENLPQSSEEEPENPGEMQGTSEGAEAGTESEPVETAAESRVEAETAAGSRVEAETAAGSKAEAETAAGSKAEAETESGMWETGQRPEVENRPQTDRASGSDAEAESQPAKETEQKTAAPGEAVQAENISNISSVSGGIEKIYMPSDVPPVDTVGFVPSRKEEITEEKYVESVVDENDPDSYQIVEKKEQVPTLYVNQAGDIKYEYKDGIWYEYKYSSVNITLDTKNENLALLILNLDGSYDDYEAVNVNCVEKRRENGDTEYEFQVRYQGIFAMKGAPVDTGNLRAEDIGRVAATRTVVTQEKVPVMHLESVGTGEYQYYGWQELEEETFYFDGEGNEVTGSQVIQGIRHEFDENGVRTSRAGVEVTEENGKIDWEKVAAAEVDFAVVQCAYRDPVSGRLTADRCARENVQGAQAAGLEVLLSVFSQAVTAEEAEEEAQYAVNLAKTYGLAAPVAITCGYANPEHGGRADGLSRSERTAYVKAFCGIIKENGYTPVIHAEKDWLDRCLIVEELMDNTLWVAEYNTNLTYTGTCGFWQYTSRGTVNGISGYTGLIISYENRRNFQ